MMPLTAFQPPLGFVLLFTSLFVVPFLVLLARDFFRVDGSRFRSGMRSRTWRTRRSCLNLPSKQKEIVSVAGFIALSGSLRCLWADEPARTPTQAHCFTARDVDSDRSGRSRRGRSHHSSGGCSGSTEKQTPVGTIPEERTHRVPDLCDSGLRGAGLEAPRFVVAGLAGVLLGLFAGSVLVSLLFRNREADDAMRRGFEMGDLDGAIAELRSSIETGPPDGQQHNLLGVLLFQKEQWADAYKEYLEAEALLGRELVVLNNMAMALLKLGRPQEALEILIEANKTYPGQFIIVLNLGHVLAALNRLPEARAWLAKAEEISQNTTFLSFKAREYREQQRESVAKLRTEIESRSGVRKPEHTSDDF